MKKDYFFKLLFMCFLVCPVLFENPADIGGTTPPPKGGGPTVIRTGSHITSTQTR